MTRAEERRYAKKATAHVGMGLSRVAPSVGYVAVLDPPAIIGPAAPTAEATGSEPATAESNRWNS